MIPGRAYRVLVFLSAGIILLDQSTKAIVQSTMDLHKSVPIIPGFFNLTYIRNPGAAFGLFADFGPGARMAFFLTISVLAILALLLIYHKMPHPLWPGRLSVGLVFGGALGNLIDRIRLGEVVDFLDFYVGTLHWPAFNVADSCISVGVTLMIWFFIRQERINKAGAVSDKAPAVHADFPPKG